MFNFKKIISDKRVITLLKLFLAYVFVLIISTIGYKELPILLHYSLLGDDSFYSGLIINLYSGVIDFFVISIALYILLRRHENNDRIQLYRDNIGDCRYWYSEEAAFKNSGNIKRLQELGVKSLDLSKSTLINTKNKRIELNNSFFMGACLDNTNFDKSIFLKTDFQGASANNSIFNNVRFNSCSLKYLNFKQSQMMSGFVIDTNFMKANLAGSNFRATFFKGCNFEGADLKGCNFERSDLRGAINITATQLLQCANIKYAKVNKSIANDINAHNPNLLQ